MTDNIGCDLSFFRESGAKAREANPSDRRVTFTVPGEPRGWQRTGQRIRRSKKTGRLFVQNFTRGETRAEEDGIKHIAAAAMRGRSLLDGPLVLEAIAYLSVPRSWSMKRQRMALAGHIFPAVKPDFDNLAKLCSDALNKVVWRDDAVVVRAFTDKRYSDRPRLEVCIYPRAPDAAPS